jgi:fumarate hydratase, class II
LRGFGVLSQFSTPSISRTEQDTFGPIEVPAERYWGEQTQRSMQNFRIGVERMPRPLIHALGLVKNRRPRS